MESPLIDSAGWYSAARRYPSPHCDARPDGADVELLVIHNISLPRGQFGGPHIADLFTGRLDFHAAPDFADLRGVRVSAHFLIRRDGRVLQFVPTVARAWHAGASQFQGRTGCNDFSVGIEMEGSDDVVFLPAQYVALATLTLALQLRHPLSAITGHQHIAPARKTDPGPCFDWLHYDAVLAEQQQRSQAAAQKSGAALVPAYGALRMIPLVKNVNTLGLKK